MAKLIESPEEYIRENLGVNKPNSWFYRERHRARNPEETTKRQKLEYVRGLFLFLSYTTYFMGMAALPFAEIAAIRFSTPLMITLLSVGLLRAGVSLQRWVALIVGSMGVLVIIRPGSASSNVGSIFIPLNVLFYRFAVRVTRRLQTTDSSATMSHYSSLVYVVIAMVIAPIVTAVGGTPNGSIAFLFRAWNLPTVLDLIIMFGLGLAWSGGMCFSARAYSLALASVVAPSKYMTLPISTLWGPQIGHNFPPLARWIGAFIPLVSSLYTLYSDKKERFENAAKSAEKEINNHNASWRS